jgi:hypothetical protein
LCNWMTWQLYNQYLRIFFLDCLGFSWSTGRLHSSKLFSAGATWTSVGSWNSPLFG